MRKPVLFVIALGAAAPTTGCGVPLRWTRIVEPAPTQGVRYVLRRPAYEASIVFDARVPKLRIVQTLDGPPLVFEARSRVNPLADTKTGLKIGEKGAILSMSGGETDRTLEVFEAVLGALPALADAGPVAAEDPRSLSCAAVRKRITDHLTTVRGPLLESHQALEARIATEEAELRDVLAQPQASARIARLKTLRGEQERAGKRIAEDSVPLGKDDFSVSIATEAERSCGKGASCPDLRVHGSAASCVQVVLSLERTL